MGRNEPVATGVERWPRLPVIQYRRAFEPAVLNEVPSELGNPIEAGLRFAVSCLCLPEPSRLRVGYWTFGKLIVRVQHLDLSKVGCLPKPQLEGLTVRQEIARRSFVLACRKHIIRGDRTYTSHHGSITGYSDPAYESTVCQLLEGTCLSAWAAFRLR